MMSTNIFRSVSLSFFGLLVSTVAITTSQVQSANAGVVGQENRVLPSQSSMINSGRRPVGKLEIQKADGLYYHCSFTVIGPNIGLTNTHCLLDDRGRPPMQVKAFSLKYYNQSPAASSVDAYWTGRDSIPRTLQEFSGDWAVIRFSDSRFTPQGTGSFGNEAYYNDVRNSGRTVVGQQTNLIGYSADIQRGAIPSGHFGCQLQQVVAGVIQHNCDSTGGSSGSGMHNSALRIQALHAGEVSNGGKTLYNIAVPLEKFMPAVAKLRSTGGSTNTSVPRV